MQLEMLEALRERAEFLLQVPVGAFAHSAPIYLKGRIEEFYKNETRFHRNDALMEARLLSMLTWLAACAWWSALGPGEVPAPEDFGIFTDVSVGSMQNRTLKIYCHDYTQFKSLPPVVEYCGVKFGKVHWEGSIHRATYRNNVPSVTGVL